MTRIHCSAAVRVCLPEVHTVGGREAANGGATRRVAF